MTTPIVVLAAPGAGGAHVAAALARATDRPLAAWDEVLDEGHGDGQLVRSACRELLWCRDRDWTCPPAQLVVDEDDVALAAPLGGLLARGAVVHDVGLPHVLPVLARLVTTVQVVVVVRDPAEALPALLDGQALEPSEADDLLRVVHARLAAVADLDDAVAVVDVSGGADVAARIADLLGVAAGPAAPLPPVEASAGIEEDAAVLRLQEHVARAPGDLDLAALVDRLGPAPALHGIDPYGGPRTAARRAVVHGLVARAGRHEPVLECTRARAAGVWLPSDDVATAHVPDVAGMQVAVTRAPASIGTVLLVDALSWCGAEDLRRLLGLAMEVVRYGGVVAVARSAIDDQVREAAGGAVLTDAAVTTVAEDLGLVALPPRAGDGVRVLPFAAQTAVAGTIRDLEARVERLEEHLARRTEQRDAAVARYDALRGRRIVQVVLRVTDALGALVARLRGAGRRGAGRRGAGRRGAGRRG